jgi:hypothetical protein
MTEDGYQPSWHQQDVTCLYSTGYRDTSWCLSGRDWQPWESDTTCGVVSELGHAESWWGADCIRRVLGKDWQTPMMHNPTEPWHHHTQFRHLTQLPGPQAGYNKPAVTLMNPTAWQGKCISRSTKHLHCTGQDIDGPTVFSHEIFCIVYHWTLQLSGLHSFIFRRSLVQILAYRPAILPEIFVLFLRPSTQMLECSALIFIVC